MERQDQLHLQEGKLLGGGMQTQHRAQHVLPILLTDLASENGHECDFSS